MNCTFKKNGNGDKKTKKKRQHTDERKQICCLTLQEKVDEVHKGSDRTPNIIESIRNRDLNKINEFNFKRYLPLFISCHKIKNQTPDQFWNCFHDKMICILNQINSTFFSDENVSILEKNFGDDKTICQLIKKRQEEYSTVKD